MAGHNIADGEACSEFIELRVEPATTKREGENVSRGRMARIQETMKWTMTINRRLGKWITRPC